MMKNPAIQDLIREKMGGWDGVEAGRFSAVGSQDLKAWALDMYVWAKAVRRDILVLEYHLKQNRGVTADDLYGDPGDPPPPPE